jgi:hypothetical protein
MVAVLGSNHGANHSDRYALWGVIGNRITLAVEQGSTRLLARWNAWTSIAQVVANVLRLK